MPVPILDTNKEAQSYTHLHVNKPYIALNSETYIALTQQELRSCKKIGNEFYCEELFVVKHNLVAAVKVLLLCKAMHLLVSFVYV